MEPERLPLVKVFDVPFLSLDGTSVEMASLLFFMLVVVVIANARRRRQLLRRVVQVGSLLFFFYVVYSCLGVFGMIRNSLYGLTLVGTTYTESFYWMALPVVVASATLVTGPVFCGWICPTGTLQDIVVVLRRRLAPSLAKPSRKQVALLGVLLVAFLALLVGLSSKQQLFLADSSLHWAAGLILLCYLVLAGVVDDQPSRKLRVLSVIAIVASAVAHVTITSPTHFAFTARGDPASALSTFVVGAASFVVLRSWCRYLCPWGWVTGFLARFSRLQIRRDGGLCTACRTCSDVCDVAAVERGVVRVDQCQFCMACVDRCPSAALSVRDVWLKAAQGHAQQQSAGA